MRIQKHYEEDMKEEYARLYDYATELRRSKPGNTIKVAYDNNIPNCNPEFQGFYVYFVVMKNRFITRYRLVI